MNSQTYFVGSKYFVAALFAGLLLCSFAAPAHAQTTEETIDSLSQALAAIGDQVASSPNISDADRLVLLTQLIEVSQAIVVLQELALQERLGAQTGNQADNSTVSALVDADVYRFVAQVDLEEREAAVTTYYHRTEPQTYRTETQTISFSAPDADDTFARQIRDIEDQVAREIANDTGFAFDEVRGYLFMSAYNPDREEMFRQNLPEAFVLASDFGERSLIESVALTPDENTPLVTVTSDRAERVVFEIEENPVYTGNIRDGYEFARMEYDVTASMYLIDFNDYRIPRGDDDPLRPLITYTEEEMSEQDVLEFIAGTFSDLPFAAEIPDLEASFLRFMFESEANYEYGRRRSPDQEQLNQCVDPGDRLILDEYVVSLLQGMQVQFINQPGIVNYSFPTVRDEDQDEEYDGCRDVAAFF